MVHDKLTRPLDIKKYNVCILHMLLLRGSDDMSYEEFMFSLMRRPKPSS